MSALPPPPLVSAAPLDAALGDLVHTKEFDPARMVQLLNEGANPHALCATTPTTLGGSAWTAWGRVVRRYEPGLVALMAAHGVDPNSPLWWDGSRASPCALAFICANGADTPMVRALLKAGADPNRGGGKDDQPPIILAARHAHGAGVVRDLLKAGADPNTIDPRGDTALHILLRRVTAPTVAHRILKEFLRAGADPNARNADGRAPVGAILTRSLAAPNRSMLPLYEALLGAGADPNDGGPQTNFLSVAVRLGAVPLVKKLVERGANPDAKPKNGPSAYNLARTHGSLNTDILAILQAARDRRALAAVAGLRSDGASDGRGGKGVSQRSQQGPVPMQGDTPSGGPLRRRM